MTGSEFAVGDDHFLQDEEHGHLRNILPPLVGAQSRPESEHPPHLLEMALLRCCAPGGLPHAVMTLHVSSGLIAFELLCLPV